MKQHRILYIAPEIAIPGIHGGSTHVQEAVESLIKLGNQVTLLSKWQKGQHFWETKRNLTIIRKPFPKNGLLKNITYLLYSLTVTPLLMLLYPTDIVYERSRLFSGLATFYARFMGKKVIYELNEPIETIGKGLGPLQKLAIWWGRLAASRATLVTGTHSLFFKHLRKDNNLLIHYGVDPNNFQPNKKEAQKIIKKYKLHKDKVIFYQGSFAPWHAVASMIYAAKEVVSKDKQAQFLLVGEGKQREQAKQLVQQLSLEKNVILPGKVPYKEMPNYMNTSTITLALFDREHFKTYDYYYSAIKIHEYKACGKPIVASNIGNLKKLVVNGKNGYGVDERKVLDISGAILKLLKSKRLREMMGKKNRQEVLKTYNWDVINKEILRKLK